MKRRQPIENPLVERETIRLAMLGCSAGNGHPYSWSAIFNGYNRELMTAECPFPGIPEYLNKEPVETLVIPGAQVTHICCVGDGGFTAELEGCSLTVARDAKVPAIYAEYLGGGGCSAKGVQAYFEGCLNVMAEIGMMDPRPAPTAPEVVAEDPRPNSGHMQICLPSPVDGYFESAVALGQTVEHGQILGNVVEPLKTSGIAVTADKSGRIIVLRNCPAVKEGDSLAVILETEIV